MNMIIKNLRKSASSAFQNPKTCNILLFIQLRRFFSVSLCVFSVCLCVTIFIPQSFTEKAQSFTERSLLKYNLGITHNL